MVPVLNKDKNPLMPCSEKRARKLMERGEAKPFWKQGIFCIILQKEPSSGEKQYVVIAIDSGSKRTGITVATQTQVVCNMLFNTPDWVKKAVELRRTLRGRRRSRNTPYRKCRYNRATHQKGWVPPSTKSRWQAHIRVIDVWRKLAPLSDVVIEDISAITKKGKRAWNAMFSPLEHGKKWFNYEIVKRDLMLTKFKGYDTCGQRQRRGFEKTKSKLADVWEAHNVDSHCLSEMWHNDLKPYKGFIRCDFLKWHRRQLHFANPKKSGKRSRYGSTRSAGMKRGSLVNHPKYGLCILGGESKGRVSIHCRETNKRLTQKVKQEDVKIVSNLKWGSVIHP